MQLLVDPLGSGHRFDVGGRNEYRAAAVGVQPRFATCVSPLERDRFRDTEFVEQVLNELTCGIHATIVGVNPDGSLFLNNLEGPIVDKL
jgi:hypothetical protein